MTQKTDGYKLILIARSSFKSCQYNGVIFIFKRTAQRHIEVDQVSALSARRSFYHIGHIAVL